MTRDASRKAGKRKENLGTYMLHMLTTGVPDRKGQHGVVSICGVGRTVDLNENQPKTFLPRKNEC